jgi:O-antigen ligase
MTATTHDVAYANAMTRDNAVKRFPEVIGFFFVFRACLTYLFFQADPAAGTIVSLAINLGLLFGALLYSIGGQTSVSRGPIFPSAVRWMLALFTFSAASLFWTGAQSLVAAVGYWTVMTTDVAIVLVLLRGQDAMDCTEALMRGAVWGAAGLAIVAWFSPLTADLRLGNDEFLHPNTLGLELGIATLIAQYLATRGGLWKWLSFALGVTLLRTLSKTAILAFVCAECWYLMQNGSLTRRVKLQLSAVPLLVVASFWSVFDSYLTVYNSTGTGNQAETLTGRTVLWSVAFSMSMQRPWLGHGIYSFKALIPALGPFAAVHAHNEILQQFFEYGIAGTLIVVALYVSFLRQAWRAPASELRMVVLAVLIFTLLRGLADTVLVGLSYHLWLMAAFAVCLANSQEAEVGTL